MPDSNIKIIAPNNHTPKTRSISTDFIKHTFSKTDLKKIFELGVEVYNETECIDERADAQTIFSGKIRIENNIPGGGFDYYDSLDIQILLKSSRGNVILDPHRSCGWGGIRMNYYLSYKKPITEALPATTMVIPPGVTFDNGIEYVKHLVARAFSKNNFLNSVMRSSSLKATYQYQKDFKQALEDAFTKKGEIIFKNDLHKDLVSIAFVYGKMLELKEIMEEEAEILGMPIYNIRLNPDMLFDKPDDHIAKDAIFNLTNRKFYSRIPRSDKFETFYNDVSVKKLGPVFLLVAQIMAGDHSNTKDLDHDFYIFVTGDKLDEVRHIIMALEKDLKKLAPKKSIYIIEVDAESSPKSKNELLDLVR